MAPGRARRVKRPLPAHGERGLCLAQQEFAAGLDHRLPVIGNDVGRRIGFGPLLGQIGAGFRANGDYVVTGVKETPLLPGVLALALALGALILAWRREGR